MLAVGCAERELVVVRLLVERARVERPVRPLLQLDGVRSPLVRGMDQPLRLLDIALVVLADLRDDIAGSIVVDVHAVDGEPAHRHHRLSMLVAGAGGARTNVTSASTSSRTSPSKPSSGRQPNRSFARAGSPTRPRSSAAPRCSAGSTRTYCRQSSPTWSKAHSTRSRTEWSSPLATT